MNSYDEALKNAITQYKASYQQPLSTFKCTEPIPTSLVDLLAYQKLMKARLQQLQSIKVQPCRFDPKSIVLSSFDVKRQEQERVRNSLQANANAQKEQMEKAHQQALIDAKAYNESLANPMREKHNELLSYKDELTYIFQHYDISPLDIEISDKITLNEFGTLIDESLATCKKYMKKGSGLFEKITAPLKGETNLAFTASCVAIALILIYFLTPILAFVAFPLLFMSVHSMYKDKEKLQVACSLMTQLDYNRFVPEDQLRTVEDIDTSSVDTKLQEDLANLSDIGAEQDAAVAELNKDMERVTKELNDAYAALCSEVAGVLDSVKKRVSEVDAKVVEMLKDYHPFPTVANNSVVMSHSYVLGKVEGTLDVTVDLPARNIVFDSTDRAKAINTIKLYLANALLSVRVKQLTIDIYDPKNMCSDFAEFFTPETKPYIKPNMSTFDELIKTYRKYSQDNILELDHKTIDEYNLDAEKRELVPKEYKLLVILSEFDKVKKEDGESKRLFQEWFQFSCDSGCMVWLLDNQKQPNSIWVDGSYGSKGTQLVYSIELGKQAVATYSTALAKFKDRGIDYITKFGDVYIPKDKWWTFDTIKGIKMPFGLENGDPTRGLNVAPEIGDANVHALLGGATGAGKSAAINQLLVSLITLYPPSELQIVYIDFKNVEAAKFTKGYDLVKKDWMKTEDEKACLDAGRYYTRLSRIPHLRIISGTTDGEYALSVFEFLMAEMAHRQEIINKFGVTKVQSMRETILDSYNKAHNTPKGTWADMRKDWEWYKPNVYDKYGDLPRLLVIFDEFQVMYNPEFVPQKIIDQINGKITAITKLARAMGAHFWFTSQSMKGTMSKDTIANFSLRGALRCTTEVSEELLGNPAAGTIKAKFGYMYTNDSAGQDRNANKLWRVPFLDDKHKEEDTRPFRDMFDYVNAIIPLCASHNETHNMAEFYDEKVLVPADEMDRWYTNYSDIFSDPNVFVLGERAAFSTNKAPLTLKLMQDGGENVMIAAFDRNDMLNLVMTMIRNLKLSGNPTILINCQDAESHTLMDVENILEPKYVPLASPKQDITEFIEALEGIVARRQERGGPFTDIYVFLIQWERAPMISVDINYKMQERFKGLLRDAPSFGMHFIFGTREKLELPRMIPMACNHRVCGLIPKDSFFFIEDSRVEKLPDASKDAGLFAIYEFGTTRNKFRIYQHTYSKQLESREIVL